MSEKGFNGNRLKAARTYRGLTIAELAEKLGLQRQTVSMYESSRIKLPEYQVVTNMADILDFPTEFFLEEDKVNVQSGSTYFRALLTTNKKYRNQQVQKMMFLTQIYQFLSDYIEFPAINLPSVEGETDIEIVASMLRDCWHLGDKPIDNLVYHAEQNGIIVTSFDTDVDEIDAFSQMVMIGQETRYLVAYSKNKTAAARIHFDIAHELGHILLHEWSEDIEALSRDEFREREQQAHAFAAAFLLPREPFERDLGRYASNLSYYTVLKEKWKVSIAAMIRRAYSLEKIDQFTYQKLMRNMQKQGIRKEEPLDDTLYTAKPTLLRTSINMLIQDNVFSAKELMEELADDYGLPLSSIEVEHLLDLPKGTLAYSNIIPIHKLQLRQSNT